MELDKNSAIIKIDTINQDISTISVIIDNYNTDISEFKFYLSGLDTIFSISTDLQNDDFKILMPFHHVIYVSYFF